MCSPKTTPVCGFGSKLYTGIDDPRPVPHSAGMNIGVAKQALGYGLLAVVVVACGGSDDPVKSNCGTAQAPVAIELKDVSPALGVTVPNSAIVQTFTIVGRHLQIDPSFGLPAAHTAGQPVPSPTQWSLSVSGADTVYTSMPFNWLMAPAHVEIDSAGLQKTSDGCFLALPKQLFQYDISAP